MRSATASAARQIFQNPGWQAESWIAGHAVLMAIVWPLLLVAIFLPLSVYTYRRRRREVVSLAGPDFAFLTALPSHDVRIGNVAAENVQGAADGQIHLSLAQLLDQI